MILLDVDTASELARFNRDDPRFQGFLGGFQQVLWHRHDGGLTIGSGGVQVEGDHAFRQSLAYVDPDGKVTITVVDASAAVAPDGERVLAGSPATPGCMGFVSTHELRLVDLSSGKVLNAARDADRGLRAEMWINADRPIYRSLADASCRPTDESTTTWELPPAGPPIQQAVEPYDQLEASRPSLDIEVSCGGSQPAPWGDGGYSPYPARAGGGCRPISVPLGYTPTPGNEQGRLYIRGRLIAEMTNFTFIGAVTLARP